MHVAQSNNDCRRMKSTGSQKIVADRASDRNVSASTEARTSSIKVDALEIYRWIADEMENGVLRSSYFCKSRGARNDEFPRRSRTRGKFIPIVSTSHVAFLSRYFEICGRQRLARRPPRRMLCCHRFLKQRSVYYYTFNIGTLTFKSTMKFYYDIVPQIICYLIPSNVAAALIWNCFFFPEISKVTDHSVVVKILLKIKTDKLGFYNYKKNSFDASHELVKV